MIQQTLEKLLAGEDLTRAETERAMEAFLSGQAGATQFAAFRTALEMKGWTKDERAAFDAALARHPDYRLATPLCLTPGQPIRANEFVYMAAMYVTRGDDMSRREAENVMEEILAGRADELTIAELLTALRFKGETVDEIVGFATVMRRHAPRIFPDGHPIAEEALVDTCGTGGDARGTFNISTATAFVVAGAGVRVAKHGNRSHSSLCGSADVLEEFGVRIDLAPDRVAPAIEQVGIGFLFAPAMHAATRHVAKVRHELKVRTVFNLLGPLTNPAGASAQVVGVYDPGVTESMAQALGELGVRRAFVVHGADGLDEISLSGETYVSELRNGSVHNDSLVPEDFGLKRAPLEAIRGGDARRNAEIIRAVLTPCTHREPEPHRDIVLANASAALVTAGHASDLREGVRIAAESIDSGAAREKLDRLVAFSQAEDHSA